MTSEASAGQAAKEHGSRAWWFSLLIPAVALVEAGAHVIQINSRIAPEDWRGARNAVQDAVKNSGDTDGVIIAPRWAEPTARAEFGRELATLERMAPGDFQRYRRVVELSVRGEHATEVASWPIAEEKRFGKIAVRIHTNPSYEGRVVDLLSPFEPARATTVSFGTADCPYSRGPMQTGNLGFGPAIPGDRFNCPNGALAGMTVIADLTYRPRRCILARAGQEGSPLRVTFHDVEIGKFLVGHHGIYAEHERNLDGAPIALEARVNDQLVGRDTHVDGQAWKEFRFPTNGFPQRANVEFALTSPNAARRAYCFEATTRGVP